MLLLFILLICIQTVYASPLQGHVNNDPATGQCNNNHNRYKPTVLCQQHGKADKRGKVIKGKIEFTHIRGFIGCSLNPHTGEITSINAKSDLISLGISKGDFIIEINHEAIRPCLLPSISFYPKDYYLDLTVKKLSTGDIKHVSVKLIRIPNNIGD